MKHLYVLPLPVSRRWSPQPTLQPGISEHCESTWYRHRFWRATHDFIAPYVDIILHRGQFWAKSAASGNVRWWCFRSCWMVLSHMMRGRPNCLLQSAGGEANRISRGMGWCITRYACLLSQLTPGTHSCLARLRLSRPGCLVQRRGGLPVQTRSPT